MVVKQLTLRWDTGVSHQRSSSDLGHVTAGSPCSQHILATLTHKHTHSAETPHRPYLTFQLLMADTGRYTRIYSNASLSAALSPHAGRNIGPADPGSQPG